MTKIRKQKKRNKYNYDRNRKRLHKRKHPVIECPVIKDAWVRRMSTRGNIKKLGLVYNINKIDLSTSEEKTPAIERLEEEAYAPRKKCYRLPKHQVEYLTMLLDKYGEDYKAMARDKSNHLQHTWKQIRTKINVFMKIPEQYNEYLQSKQNEVTQQ